MVAVSEPSKSGFTLRMYAETLSAYRAEGYAVTSFANYLAEPHDQHLIMRHDIDNSLEQAMRVARADADAGCTSSFFLRAHARGYNLLSLPSLMMIREIEDLGHEVQLHLEGGFGRLLGGDENSWADRQRAIFEAAVGRASAVSASMNRRAWAESPLPIGFSRAGRMSSTTRTRIGSWRRR